MHNHGDSGWAVHYGCVDCSTHQAALPNHHLFQVVQDMQARSLGRMGGAYKQLRTLNQALIVYILVQTRLLRCDSEALLGAAPVFGVPLSQPPAGVSECPACWRTCEAVCADACMGMRRFAKSASAQRGLEPLISNTPFMSEEVVKAAQERRPHAADSSDARAAACSDFKAADLSAAEATKYDRTGVAAFLCRHGFVMRACTMFGPENFTYYEVMLADILTAYCTPQALAAGRSLKFVYVDVACKMEPMLQR
jgi:hypothetical protein